MKKNKFDLALKVGAKKLHLNRKKLISEGEKYRKKYQDKKGYIKRKFLKYRNCPICKRKNDEFLFYKNGGKYVKCKNCELIYLNPCFGDTHLENYYKGMHSMQSATIKNESEFYVKIYSYGLESINKFVKKKNKKILDIGCSNGLFLDIAKKNSWETFGIELNKKEYLISQKNHRVENTSVLNLNKAFNNKFDTICMWDVIEHVKDTNNLLKIIKRSLNKGGLFFFQTPNVNSLAARIMHEKSNVFDGIEHTNLFNDKNVNIIAKKNKFKLIKIESVISEIPIISNYLDYLDPYYGGSRKKNILGMINEKQMHENYLGYKMQVILKSI
tara:strand:+ start:140 stop:1123 length:984 start_codon:yes stop_codon:yes gene_type:complete